MKSAKKSSSFRFFCLGVVALAAIAATAPAAIAQSTASVQIQGVVQDSSGAVVPGAQITVRNVATGVERNVETNAEGRYRALGLAPGEYEITVAMSGFATMLHRGIAVEVGDTATINITLEVATTTEVIEVASSSPIVEPERTAYTATIGQEAVENLPINGRRWDRFMLLAPTVQPDGDFGLVSVRGISGLYNNNTVDGADNNQAFFSEARGRTRVSYTISQAAIKEFQVGVSNYSAEFGRAVGGTVNSVTKSGASSFHGEAFYFIRDDAFDAREPFNKAEGLDQLKDRRQQFGFSLGGSLVADKLFYFLNYDQQHRNFPGVAVDSRGLRDFNKILFTDPNFDVSLVPDGDVPGVDDPICDFATVGQARCEGARNLLLSELGPFSRKGLNNIAFGKFDWVINDRQNLSTQYNWHKWRSPSGIQTQLRTNDTPLANGFDGVRTDMFLVRHNYALSSGSINEFRFQFGRDLEFQRPNAPGPSVLHNSQLDIDGGGMRNFLPRVKFPEEIRYQFVDNFTWLRGNHLIKVGADINFVDEEQINLFSGGGVFDYRSFEAYAMDVPLSGIPIFQDSDPVLTGRHYRNFVQAFDISSGGIGRITFDTTDWNFFIHDTWKVHPNLTLNLGLRYEYTDLPTLDQVKFGCETAGTCPEWASLPSDLKALSQRGVNEDKNNLAPRIGIAWDVGGRQKLVVRTGYGLFYGQTSNSAIAAGLFENDGITRIALDLEPRDDAAAPLFPNTFCNPPLGTPGQSSTCAPPANISGSLNMNLFADDYVRPVIHSWDLDLEYALSSTMSFSATYLGSRALRLPIFVDTNLPDPIDTLTIVDGSGNSLTTLPFYGGDRPVSAFNNIIQTQSVVNSAYHGGVFRVKKRMSHGIQFDSHLTVAKAIDNGQSSTTFFSFFSQWLDPRNGRLDKGRSRFDIRRKWVTNVLYRPQIDRFDNEAARQLLNGWTFSSIMTFRDGRAAPGDLDMNFINPFSLFLGWDAISTFTANGSGADNRVPWLQQNFGETTGLSNVDIRVQRDFSVGEGKKFVFSWEAFNLFNHVNFNSFNDGAFRGTVSCTQSGGFGSPCIPGTRTVTATPQSGFLAPRSASNTFNGPREMQFAFKYIW